VGGGVELKPKEPVLRWLLGAGCWLCCVLWDMESEQEQQEQPSSRRRSGICSWAVSTERCGLYCQLSYYVTRHEIQGPKPKRPPRELAQGRLASG
jgi:hypothetical protein